MAEVREYGARDRAKRAPGRKTFKRTAIAPKP